MSDKIKISSNKNPIIPRMGVCDPHIHIFDGHAWMYAGHDKVPGNPHYSMSDWHIWSSDDLVEWQLESVVHPEDFHMGASTCCWAVDCAEKNGKYYYYFSNGNQKIGVAVGDSPAGPFKDVLGRPLLDGTVTTTTEYDPCVFKDDDGRYYIVFGGPKWAYGEGCGYFIARLGEDMMSLAEEPKYIELDHMGDDKASLNKLGGIYYLSYGGFYAISDDVYGPYKFMGHTHASIDHTSYFEWNGQLFNAITVTDNYGRYRSSGLCYVHIKKNHELVTDQLIVEYGVGKYDADWNRIEAEWFMSCENAVKVENEDLYGFSVACTKEAVLNYPNIKNLSDKIGFELDGNCVGKGGTIELREKNKDGRLIGSVSLKAHGTEYSWTNRVYGNILFDKPLSDTADICLVIKPEQDTQIRIDYFHFFADAVNGR